MEKEKKASPASTLTAVLVWGGLWGIFEATVGYLLHLLPLSIGWLVWYPVACFFMLNVYRKTRRTETILLVGLLSACIKLFNLFLPGTIDRVLNPAVSIVLEAVTLSAGVYAYRHFVAAKKKPLITAAIAILCMNTGWRVLYALYLLFLVPDWMREVSVISSANALVIFFVLHNLLTGLVLFGGSLLAKYILRPIEIFERRLSVLLSSFPYRSAAGIKLAGAVLLFGCSIALGFLIP